MYKKVLLAYDGSIEGRRALREGAKLAQFCGAEVFLLAVVEISSANLVVVGHRATGPLARWWFGSVGTYLIKHLRCSVLVAQTEISDDQFAQLLTMPASRRDM